MQNKLGVIDADGFIFFAAWGFREQLTMLGLAGAAAQMDRLVTNCLKAADVNHYLGFYGSSDEKNFRHAWATVKKYKGSRKEEPWMTYFKPRLKAHMAKKWGFYEVGKIEADDAVIIAHHQYEKDWEIVHISEDKDQKQLGKFTRMNPNKRNNPKMKIEHFEHYAGRKFFWSQMLMGDSTDNIGGVIGVGSKSDYIKRINDLKEPTAEADMYGIVRECYMKEYGARYHYHMLENYMLLCMFDKPCFDYPKNIKIQKFGGAKEDRRPVTLIDL
jgi:hypothetical protein